MDGRGPGLIGGLAAGRPILSACVIAFAATALAAVGYRDVESGFVNGSYAFLAALLIAIAAPAGIAAAAPGNFWLRMIYAGLAGGVFLAFRRIVLQAELGFGSLDLPLLLEIAAATVFPLAFCAPLWRAAVGLGLVGHVALALGAAGGLSIVALETARGGSSEFSGAALALAAGLGAALSVQTSAAFSRSFAEGGSNRTASADAAGDAAAPALFSLAIGACAVIFVAFGKNAPTAEIYSAGRAAAGAIAFSLVAVLFLLVGALSLKKASEGTAVAENRRRRDLDPFLGLVRRVLPPSSAIAASAIFLIAAIVAGFEARTAASVGEIALISAVAVFAAASFVSLRTALMTTLLYAAAGRIVAWGASLFGLASPTEGARVIASALAVALYAQLFLAWRDRRHPRRKTREVVRLALADCLFSYAAAAILGCAALAASEAAGLWREGSAAALYAGALALIGFLAGPPLMTAVGAIFGRD